MKPSEMSVLFSDVGGLLAFGTLDDFKLNILAGRQGLKAVALDRREVHEHIFSAFLLDKTIALPCVKPLHFPGRHSSETILFRILFLLESKAPPDDPEALSPCFNRLLDHDAAGENEVSLGQKGRSFNKIQALNKEGLRGLPVKPFQRMTPF